MAISQRLTEVLQKVRPEVAVPIIVEVSIQPREAETMLKGMGMSIKYTSKTLPLLYGSANTAVIRAISSQAWVKEVNYDEPIYAL